MRIAGTDAGSIKMRGKRTKLLSCRCCELWDERWEQRLKEAADEINAPIAQLEEHFPPKEEVGGSNPLGRSKSSLPYSPDA